MLSDAFLHQLDMLRLSLRHVNSGSAGGLRRSRQQGSSAEFSDFRSYAPGDDVRRLDWRAYARFDRLYMKLFTEEQESVVTICVDGSASMAFKREEALHAAQALTYLALGSGDRVRIAFLHQGQAALSPFYTGRRAWLQAADFLNSRPMSGSTSLSASLQCISPFPKGALFLITDAYADEGMHRLLRLTRYLRQECALIHVLSPEEMHPDLEGPLRLLDAEGAPPLELNVDGIQLRQYHQALDCFLLETRKACREHGAPYVFLQGDMPFESAFLPALRGSGLIL